MIEESIDQLLHFFDLYGLWIAIASVAMFVISIAAMPYIVARIPVDYFAHQDRHALAASDRHPVVRMILAILKNLLGAVLLIAGVIMLFTPGQGLLSMLFGLMLMNYPGKYQLECRIIAKPLIMKTVNSMRAKQGQPPLMAPHSSPE